MKSPKHTENALILRIQRAFARQPRHSSTKPLRLGIGDDAALFAPTPGHETVLTCDWFLQGSHFLRDTYPPDSIGWKCLARALSDIAAMGGIPRCFLLGLALSDSDTGSWLDEFLVGLRRASVKLRCPLAGGDTTRRPEIAINITVIGEVPRGRSLRRDTAKPGDLIFVSGRLGQAAAGLHLFQNGNRRYLAFASPLINKHLYPEPRLALAVWLREKRLATSAMDLSDGLSSDLARLCHASHVGAQIDTAKLPIIRAPRTLVNVAPSPLELALHGGDDYELLFTVSQRRAAQIPRSFRGLALSRIGQLTKASGIVLIGPEGSESQLPPNGWDPFRK